MKQLKNVLGVALSNVIGFGTSFIVGFILPAVLTVSDYGKYREFILYTSFAYIINLGFNDGIYIKYGGKEFNKLNKEKLGNEHLFINIFQFILLIVMVTLSFFFNNSNLLLFSVASFFITLTTYHQNLLQATGQFSIYSKTYILRNLFYIISLVVALFIFKSDSYLFYSVIYIFSYVVLYLMYEYLFIKQISLTKFTLNKDNFRLFFIGFFILIANMSLTFVGNIGNWIVNAYYSIEIFAQYSFQNSLLNIILLIVNAVGLVFYNVLSKRYDEDLINKIKSISIYLGILSGIAFFPFKIFISVVLPNYVSSISILSVTFISIPYLMTSKILIANLYKVDRNEKKYFVDSLIYAIVSLVVVFVINFIWRDVKYVALATTFCYVLWYIYCTRIEFKFLKSNLKEIITLILHSITMYISANKFNTLGGFLLYSIFLMFIFILNRKNINNVFRLG